ncbi:MAG: OsmC family protein [Candidatus Aureabacteria bacterium]|nr:OsmC family protein [Candidatus Auribacterota bacterium]
MSSKIIQVETSIKERYLVKGKARKHEVWIDQPENGGGQDKGPTPIEYFLLGLSGCLLAIARILAKQKRIQLRGMDIRVEGDLDSDFLLGKSTQGRAGLTEIRLTAKMDADLTPEQKEDFLNEMDRRCPVTENVRNATPIRLKLE